jgi:hypothetical protein
VDKTIVFAADFAPATLSSRVRRGELARLAAGVYTTDVASDPAAVVKREWHTIAGGLLPGAVITDRSGPVGGPVDGVLYLSHAARAREIALPGLVLLARPGAGPLPGDVPLPGGLHQASKARGLLENTRESRSRRGRPRRGLDAKELGDWVDRLCQTDGETALQRYRSDAEHLAAALGVSEPGIRLLGRLIGAALATQQVETPSDALQARQLGRPYDSERMRLFNRLLQALRASAPQDRPVSDPSSARYQHLPFYEAYFSNFIEGTEFELSDALAVVYDGAQMSGRADDSHDLLGTYQVVADLTEMSRVASDPDEFVQLLRSRHATILGGRPSMRPGQFKQTANRAGASLFVLPALVDGTLRAGFARIGEVDTAFERAIYMMFLVSEVHPFDDGNGRIARVMMNAELVTGGQSRIIIPTVFRDDYVGALRRLTRDADASVLIKALRYAHDYTSRIDFSTLDGATAALRETNAFNEPESDQRLQLPSG